MPGDAAQASTGESWLIWAGFGLFVVLMLVLDLKVFHRHAHEVRTKEALGWSIFWVALALAFNALLIPWFGPELGPQRAAEFLTAYLLEKSLSVDNLFVFVVLFQYFHVPGALQHRVLFFGVLGAIVMRLVFILVGAGLLAHFHWMTYVFGGILIVTAGKLMFSGEGEADPSKNLALRVAKRWFRFSDSYDGQAMTVVRDGVRVGTPLLLVLIVIEATDVVFAVDSVPACLAVSRDPFIVFTSNIFAILGLRALYFLLARFLGSFRFLKYGLAVVLAFVGAKMIDQGLGGWFGKWLAPRHPSLADALYGDRESLKTWVSLAFIAGVLAVATTASLLRPKREEPAAGGEAADRRP